MDELFWYAIWSLVCDLIVIVPIAVTVLCLFIFIALKIDKRLKIKPIEKFLDWLFSEE